MVMFTFDFLTVSLSVFFLHEIKFITGSRRDIVYIFLRYANVCGRWWGWDSGI